MVNSEKTPHQAEWAIYFYDFGLQVIPVHGIGTDGLCTCKNIECEHSGKHPMSSGWAGGKGFFNSEEEIRQYWQRHPNANYGILTTGLVVIDVDKKNGGVESFERELKPIVERIDTLVVGSGSGGGSKHLYFRDSNSEFRNCTGMFPGIDVRATGGFVVGLGSIHKSGNAYSVIEYGDKTGASIKIANLPEEIRRLLLDKNERSRSKHEIQANIVFGGEIKQGSRNSTMTSYAGKLRQKGLTPEEIEPILIEKNKQCVPPLKDSEISSIVKSIGRYPVGGELDWKAPNLSYSVRIPEHQDIPVELIPDWFSDFVILKGKSLGVPLAAIMVTLLTVISGILGAAFKVKPNKKVDYEEPLNLWGLIIAPPSSRKTPVLSIAQKVLKIINSFYSEKRKDFEVKREIEIAKLRTEQKTVKDDKTATMDLNHKIAILKKTESPKWSFVANDVTPEALAQLFQCNYRGILLFKDELDGVLSKFAKNGYEDFRSFLCEAWNGARPYQINRVGRGLIDIESVTLAVLGGIQPDVIGIAFNDELRKGLGGDGLLARFQLCAIYHNRDLKQPDTSVDMEYISHNANCILTALHEITKDYNLTGATERQPIFLSSDGERLFNIYTEKIAGILGNEDNLNQAYKSHIGKFGRLVLSLSAQFHIVDSIVNEKEIDRPVEKKWVQLAIKWADYMEEQAKNIYFNIGKNSSVNTLLSRIRSLDIYDGMSVRSIYRKCWSGLQHRDDVLSAIEAISESQWVKIISGPPSGGGPTTEIVRINPKLINFLKNKSIGRTDNTDEFEGKNEIE
ncbi:MAG: DUF3987 domain-containing protein [Bdellovibrionaceae bacterium]|nr:DUF3987 domain-containing protein [Pseudobdellovibrionaceae bacterium]